MNRQALTDRQKAALTALWRDAVLVLAGTREEAEHHARRLGLDEKRWIYVTPGMTRGRRNPVVYRVGRWYENPDLPQIEMALAPTNPSYVDA